MQQEIRVDIAPDGSVKIDAVGFAGPDCEQATAFLEQALGEATGRQHKPEFHRQQLSPNRRRQTLGR